jgi:hypothetical protein
MRASAALLGLLAVTLLVAASSGGAVTPNVQGTFVRSSQSTTCYQGEPCDPPPQAAFLLFTRNGHSTRARLAAHGAFAVELAAGVYRVSVLPGNSSTVSPSTLRVPRVGVIHPRFVQKAAPVPG